MNPKFVKKHNKAIKQLAKKIRKEMILDLENQILTKLRQQLDFTVSSNVLDARPGDLLKYSYNLEVSNFDKSIYLNKTVVAEVKL